MDVRVLFGLSVLMSFTAFGIVTKLYIWPRLRVMRPKDALTPLVAVARLLDQKMERLAGRLTR
jgi:hypothetical protein